MLSALRRGVGSAVRLSRCNGARQGAHDSSQPALWAEMSGAPAIRCRFKSTFAVVFDIDGVLYRGSQDIEPASSVLENLQKRNVPFLFLTNGGGQTEKVKADSLSQRLGFDIDAKQVFLSHTPMRDLHEYKEKLVLAVGKQNAREVLENYGFSNIVTVDEFHEQHPQLFPDCSPETIHGRHVDEFHEPIAAVMGIMDPVLWSRDLQICCDVLRSNGIVGTLSKTQEVPLFLSCPDFEYVTEFPVPRFGSGTFGMVLEHLFERLTARQLKTTWFGKPVLKTYISAEKTIAEIAKEKGYDSVHHIYAIGDNPLSDIAGANAAGDKWSSILVRTGMFQGDDDEDNDADHPADRVCGDVGDALTFILGQELRREASLGAEGHASDSGSKA